MVAKFASSLKAFVTCCVMPFAERGEGEDRSFTRNYVFRLESCPMLERFNTIENVYRSAG